MFKCPACGEKIQPGEYVCPSCGESLAIKVLGTTLDLTGEGQLEVVATLENEVEGPVLQSVLEGAGIPSMVRNLNVVEYWVPEAGQTAWGELLVLQAHAVKARIVLDEYLRSLQEPPSENAPPETGEEESGNQ